MPIGRATSRTKSPASNTPRPAPPFLGGEEGGGICGLVSFEGVGAPNVVDCNGSAGGISGTDGGGGGVGISGGCGGRTASSLSFGNSSGLGNSTGFGGGSMTGAGGGVEGSTSGGDAGRVLDAAACGSICLAASFMSF